MTHPTLNEENILWQQGYQFIAGVGEVGRGCFAGPIVAAAVILPQGFSATKGINDSKLLTPKKREKLAKIIKQASQFWAAAEICVKTINEVGIGKATQQVLSGAVLALKQRPHFVLSDAYFVTGFKKHLQKPIIHGDRLSISIAAASIIAKVHRDALMRQLHGLYPLYDFATNKGYGTKKHREAIGRHGLCALHRTSFKLDKFVGVRH